MSDIPRLNGIIRALEAGKPAFTSFAKIDRQTAIEMSDSPYDGIVYEMEHNPYDITALTDALQYMLSRSQILKTGSPAPAVTPIARIPANGAEMNQAFSKQVLDRGVYGVIWPHINNVAQAYNAVASCRYGRPKNASLYEPQGKRGDGPMAASRYWGLTQAEYYSRADVWPLAPQGEIFVMLMIESVAGIENLDDILANVPGVGGVLIGEGDLSQELGHPRDYDHPVVVEWMNRVVTTCKAHNIPVGHPHVDTKNVERIVSQGYRFLMAAPVRSYAALDMGRKLTGR